MSQEESMEEYEFINKDDLDESLPVKTAEMASSAASATSVFQDRNTHVLAQLRAEEEDDSEEETEVSSPVANLTARPRVAQDGWDPDMAEEGREDLCILSTQVLTLFSGLLGTVKKGRTWAATAFNTAFHALKGPQAEGFTGVHGVSAVAAAFTLLLSLLLVHRADRSPAPVTGPSPMVSLATFGSSCSPLPSAALDLVRNFTAAQRLQEAAPSDGHLILAVYAAHVAEQFDRARRVHKKGIVQPKVFGPEAKALLKATQKELKQTAKWAEHELHSLPKQHRRFVQSLHEAVRLDREAVDHLAEQLPQLISALDGNDAYALRRHSRTLGHLYGKAAAAAEAARAHYGAVARGVDHAVAALDAHWNELGPAMQAAAEGELNIRRESWKALALAICISELEQASQSGLAGRSMFEACPSEPMSGLAAQLQTSAAFQQRFLALLQSSRSVTPAMLGQHRGAQRACERGGGLSILLQVVHKDLAAVSSGSRAAASAA